MPKYAFHVIAYLSLLLSGCDGESVGEADARRGGETDPVTLTVYATTYPLAYFTQRIAGDVARVQQPLPSGTDPAHWMPPSETIAALQRADLVVSNGAGLESWLQRASLPPSRLVRTARALEDEWIEGAADRHTHGPTGEHAHARPDPYTWLDPLNAMRQASAVRDALTARVPEGRTAFEAGFDRLAQDLTALHARLEVLSESAPGVPLLAAQPKYNYLARRYGWNLINLPLDPAREPDTEGIQRIQEALRAHPARQMLWSEPPAEAVARALETRFGLASVVFDPCTDSAAGADDYLAAMHRNIDALALVFRPY